MNKKNLDLLYRSFDTELSAEEASQLQEALASSGELRMEQRRLAEMREMVADSAQTSFKPFFSSRVMRKIGSAQEQPDVLFTHLLRYFQRFAIAGGVAAALLVLLNFQSHNSISVDLFIGSPKIQLEDTWALDDFIEEAEHDR